MSFDMSRWLGFRVGFSRVFLGFSRVCFLVAFWWWGVVGGFGWFWCCLFGG